jgi:hypothetical protein
MAATPKKRIGMFITDLSSAALKLVGPNGSVQNTEAMTASHLWTGKNVSSPLICFVIRRPG